MIRGIIYGLLAAAIWGGMYVISDVVLVVIPPFSLLTLRLIQGIAVLGFILWRREHTSPGTGLLPGGRERWRLLGVGVVGFGLGVGLQFVGTDKSTAVNGALVTSASPAFILLFAAAILRERLTPQRIAAVVLATIGVVVIVDPAQADFSSQTFIGDMALALSALLWALYSVLVRGVSAQHDTLIVTLMAFIGGLFITLPGAAVEAGTRGYGPITTEIAPGIIAGILYLGVISTAGAMWLWNRAFALVDASIAALCFFAQPVVGALLGVLVLGQAMTVRLWIGAALIGIGVLLSILRGRRPAAIEQPAA